MSSPAQRLKAIVKLAREAVQEKRYADALRELDIALMTLVSDAASNYHVHVLRGLSLFQLGKSPAAIEAYQKAIDLDKQQPLAWQGMLQVFEKSQNVTAQIEPLEALREMFVNSDPKKHLEMTMKLIDIYFSSGKEAEGKKLLERLIGDVQTPSTGPYASVDPLPKESTLLSRLLSIIEEEESSAIRKEIETRRKRLGAGTLNDVTMEVEGQVMLVSKQQPLLERLLLLSENDESIAADDVSFKLVKYLNVKQRYLDGDEQQQLHRRIRDLCIQLVTRNYKEALPIIILLEDFDAPSPDCYDPNLLLSLKQSTSCPTSYKSFIGAHDAWKLGDMNTAISLFEAGIKEAPSSVFGSISFVGALMHQQQFHKAINIAIKTNSVIENHFKSTSVEFPQMQLYLSFTLATAYCQADMQKYRVNAMQLFEKVLEWVPNHLGALQGLAQILSDRRMHERALEINQRILILQPQSHAALSEISWQYFQMKEMDKALSLAQQAALMFDASALYHYRLGRIYWALGDKFQTDKQFAFSHFLKAAQRNPNGASAFAYLGHFYLHQEKDRERAKKCYQKAFTLDPSDTDAGHALSDLYFEDQALESVILVLDTVVTSHPHMHWAWRRLGFTYLMTKRYQKAIHAFQTTLRVESEDAQAWEGLAEAYQWEGRYVSSLKAFERAQQLSQKSPYTYYMLGLLHLRVGALSKSLNALKTAVAFDLKELGPLFVPCQVALGDTLVASARDAQSQGMFARAGQFLREALTAYSVACEKDGNLISAWKGWSDASLLLATMPNQVQLMIDELNLLMKKVDQCANGNWISKLKKLGIETQPWMETLNSSVILSCVQCTVHALSFPQLAPITMATFWYNLGLAFFYWPSTESKKLAIRCLYAALTLDSKQALYWNALGLFTIQSDPILSQHCFIRAIEYDTHSALSWTHLGFLYWLHEDISLANQAFSMAQTTDPDAVHAWLGQALIAGVMDPVECQSLLSHCMSLTSGTLGFVNRHFVSFTLPKILTLKGKEEILHLMHFALTKVEEQLELDCDMLHCHGLVLERLNQLDLAALKMTVLAGRFDKAHAFSFEWMQNISRIQLRAGSVDESIRNYEKLNSWNPEKFKSSISCVTGLALALAKKGLYQEALKWTSTLSASSKPIVLLNARILFANSEYETMKHKLIEAVKLDSSFVEALILLAAAAMLKGDAALALSVVQQIEQRSSDVENSTLADLAVFLSSRLLLLQGQDERALTKLHESGRNVLWAETLLSMTDLPLDEAIKTVQYCLEQAGAHVNQKLLDLNSTLCIANDQAASLSAKQREILHNWLSLPVLEQATNLEQIFITAPSKQISPALRAAQMALMHAPSSLDAHLNVIVAAHDFVLKQEQKDEQKLLTWCKQQMDWLNSFPLNNVVKDSWEMIRLALDIPLKRFSTDANLIPVLSQTYRSLDAILKRVLVPGGEWRTAQVYRLMAMTLASHQQSVSKSLPLLMQSLKLDPLPVQPWWEAVHCASWLKRPLDWLLDQGLAAAADSKWRRSSTVRTIAQLCRILVSNSQEKSLDEKQMSMMRPSEQVFAHLVLAHKHVNEPIRVRTDLLRALTQEQATIQSGEMAWPNEILRRMMAFIMQSLPKKALPGEVESWEAVANGLRKYNTVNENVGDKQET